MESRLDVGDALTWLRGLPAGSAQCCVTSPPYYGLRDYGVDGQIGLERSSHEYVAKMVAVFQEVRRVLADDGTLWLNLGDSYSAFNGNRGQGGAISERHEDVMPARPTGFGLSCKTLKNKDRMMIPARVALALQADGWFLRDEIVWHKPRATPASVKDRTTPAHEMVYLLAKRERYFYDQDAIREPHTSEYSKDAISKAGGAGGPRPAGDNFNKQRRRQDGTKTPATRAERAALLHPGGRNPRSVWSISPQPYREAHFATMPPALARRCVLAGSRPRSLVIDPFAGAGTTLLVAQQENREWAGCDINPEYVALAEARLMKEMLGGAT